jgi:hypothetical protein
MESTISIGVKRDLLSRLSLRYCTLDNVVCTTATPDALKSLQTVQQLILRRRRTDGRTDVASTWGVFWTSLKTQIFSARLAHHSCNKTCQQERKTHIPSQTASSQVPVEKLLVPQQLTDRPHFRELDGSLQRSQQLVTCLYLEPN